MANKSSTSKNVLHVDHDITLRSKYFQIKLKMRHSNVQMKMSREKGVDVVVVVRAQHSTSHVT